MKALLKGLEPLLKPAELDVAAIVEAIGAIPAPQFEMVLPDADPVPYTFEIQRDGSGNIERVLATPGRINHQAVAADYVDGILTLTLPKAEEEKNKVVKVNLG